MKIISNLIEAHIFRTAKDELEFLLLKRSANQIYPCIWQMVSGKIKNGENAIETVLREIKEETGLLPKQLWAAPKINSFYDSKDDNINIIPVFAALVDDNPIKLSSEHSEFKWVKLKKTRKLLAWPGQRESVRIIAEYFQNEKSFLKFVEVDIKNRSRSLS